jgi:hypothetical protein
MKKILGITLLAIASAFIMPAFAQKPAVIASDKAGWHKIGEVTADLKSEKDEIIVLGKDRFKSLKIVVTDQPISITSMVIYYEGGATEDVNVNANLKAGKESQVINLKGEKELNKVSFVFQTVASARNDKAYSEKTTSEKAHVELWGLK